MSGQGLGLRFRVRVRVRVIVRVRLRVRVRVRVRVKVRVYFHDYSKFDFFFNSKILDYRTLTSESGFAKSLFHILRLAFVNSS
jgi:hypothetical protein